MNTPENRPGGYFLLSRSIFENPQFRGLDDVFAAIWMIGHAAWKQVTVAIKNGRNSKIEVTLERGQLCYSLRFLASKWGCSLDTVQRRISRFLVAGFISTQTRTGITVITLCNYEQYQNFQTAFSIAPVTAVSTAVSTKKKEVKEVKERKNIYTASFEQFWALVPADHKVQGKGSIVKHYTSAEKEVGGDLLASKYLGYLKSTESAGDKKFRFRPRRWLSERHWEDEPIAVVQKPWQP
jgi:DNA-binding transcriptional regulator YhcF (GntR family)